MKKFVILPLIILLLFAAIIVAQEEDTPEPDLLLSVAGESCALEIDPESVGTHAMRPPEATPESEPETTPEPAPDFLPALPTYTLSDDCDDVKHLLTVPSNGTIWLSLSLPESEDWLPLSTIEDDPYPPKLDGRGRFFGCAIPMEGEQVCYVLTELEEETVLVALPLWVGDAYYAPQPVATEEPEAQETPEEQTGDNSSSQNNLPPTQTPLPISTEEPICGTGESPPGCQCPPPGCDPGDGQE